MTNDAPRSPTARRIGLLASTAGGLVLLPLLFQAALLAPSESVEPSAASSPGRSPLADWSYELRYQLWKRDLAPARDYGEMHDWVYRLVFESAAAPETWREPDESDDTITPCAPSNSEGTPGPSVAGK